MPIYAYRCQKCGEKFEILHKKATTKLPKCIECGSKYTEKQISRTTFRLKGGGWADEGYGK